MLQQSRGTWQQFIVSACQFCNVDVLCCTRGWRWRLPKVARSCASCCWIWYFVACCGSVFSLHRLLSERMSRAKELRHVARCITALADTEEDIALRFDSLLQSAASSRTTSPCCIPRESLRASREALAASRTRPRSPDPLPKKVPRRSTAIITTPRGSVASVAVAPLDGAVNGVASKAASKAWLEMQ